MQTGTGRLRVRVAKWDRIGRQVVIGSGRLPSGSKCYRLRCLDCNHTLDLPKWRVIEAARDDPSAIDCACIPPTADRPPVSERTARIAIALIHGAYKASAKARNLVFSLSRADIAKLVTLPCFYCTAPPSNVRTVAFEAFTYSGLDRVDSAAGYTPENVVPCCKHCNFAKRDRAQSEFIAWLIRAGNNMAARTPES